VRGVDPILGPGDGTQLIGPDKGSEQALRAKATDVRRPALVRTGRIYELTK
jgi:hypothetical protein